jgi:hypothetical protein
VVINADVAEPKSLRDHGMLALQGKIEHDGLSVAKNCQQQ